LDREGKSCAAGNGAKVLIPGLKQYTLPVVYEKIRHKPLKAHHDAKIDAYACAYILFTLLYHPKNGSFKTSKSDGYKSIKETIDSLQKSLAVQVQDKSHEDPDDKKLQSKHEDAPTPLPKTAEGSRTPEASREAGPSKRPKTLQEVGRSNATIYTHNPTDTTTATQHINALLWQTHIMINYLELDSSKSRSCSA
jgi:hypothetical protein